MAELQELERQQDELDERVDKLERRADDMERNYRELHDATRRLNDAHVSLRTYVEVSFAQIDKQNKESLEAIAKLDRKYDEMDKRSQERHDDMIQQVNDGVKTSLQAVGNSNPVWVTGTLAITATVGGICIGALVAIGVVRGWFG